MKHFYNLSLVANTQQLNAKALGMAFSTRVISLLFVCFFLLVSEEGYGQQTTYYSYQDGSWDNRNSWSTRATGQQQVPANLPGANDIVEITSGITITVPAGTFSCSKLLIHPGSGNPKVGAQIIIGSGGSATARLTTTNLLFGRATGQPKERATLRMGNNGHIIVNGSINIVDNREVIVNNPANTDIFYSFDANSIFEYSGGAQELFNFSVITNVDAETSTSYGNLILSGTGAKTASANHEIRGNLTINGTAAFSPGSFSHTVNGNLVVTSAGAGITGNSTISGMGLTVGGNVTNSGNITFLTRVLAVGGNFTNNNGATFTAGSGTHTVSGNWTNAGTFTAGSSTIVLNGLSKTISSTGTGAFNSLTVTNNKTLLSNITVNNSLSVNNTILDTEDKTIVLGEAGNIVSTENASQHIKGAIETTRSLPATRTNSEIFGNIGFRIPVSTENLGNIKVRRVTGQAFNSPLTLNNSVNRQFYVISTNNPALENLNTSIEMDFPTHDLTGTAPYDIYRITGADNRTIDKLANVSSSTGSFGYTVADAQKYGMYTLSSTITPLPVELISFKAQRHTQGVSLTWITASEQDNKGFEVQVSTDSRNFTAIGFVESKVGTTALKQHYKFLDTKAVSGTRYYRLKQIDFDGQFDYSAIKSVILDGDNGVAAAYPNPFDDVVTVKLTGTEVRQVKATLTDAMGKVIFETIEETTGNSISVNTASLATKGLYLLHVLDNGTKHTFKLMKR